jgi:hypothetical protein
MQRMAAGEQYTPLLRYQMGMSGDYTFLCFDQPRTNLFWLLEPRFDTEGLEAAKGNPITASINEHMDTVTLENLRKLPLVFLQYWLKAISGPQLMIAEKWPDDYLVTMTRRANEAQARLLGVSRQGNVLSVNFRRRA